MNGSLLVKNVTVTRGTKPVIHGIDLEIGAGKITALLGANGAGKSSLVLAIAGALPLTSGEIVADGKKISGLRPEIVRSHGIAGVPEGHQILTDLSVADNLKAAGSHLSRAELDKAVKTALDTFPELRPKLPLRAGDMSGGQQQMLALGQAIVCRPRYLLADELSFGLAPVIVARLVPVLQDLAKQGVGVLLIEQFTHIALKISDHAYVMERGRISFAGSPEELQRNPDILHSAYLG